MKTVKVCVAKNSLIFVVKISITTIISHLIL